jgi:hypothetical protein
MAETGRSNAWLKLKLALGQNRRQAGMTGHKHRDRLIGWISMDRLN